MGLVEFLTARLGELWPSDADAWGMNDETGFWYRRADVEAKQAILALHDDQHECPPDLRSTEWPPQPCLTLLLLAQPFADHPDFDPAWRIGADGPPRVLDNIRMHSVGPVADAPWLNLPDQP